jgi:pyrroloquinoline-quinone synthase
MYVIERIDAARRQWNVLAHPFYVRWEQGELTQPELARYAGQYRHAVAALAQAAAVAVPLTGPEHAAEEAAHVALWDDFAAATGARAAAPNAETERCVEAWCAPADPLAAVAVLYAVEGGQPEIARTKQAGLLEHYGFRAGTPETAYFELHAELDLEHADDARRVLANVAADEDADRLSAAAERALAGNWALLDGVL